MMEWVGSQHDWFCRNARLFASDTKDLINAAFTGDIKEVKRGAQDLLSARVVILKSTTDTWLLRSCKMSATLL